MKLGIVCVENLSITNGGYAMERWMRELNA